MATITVYQVGYYNIFIGDAEIEVADPATSPIPEGYTRTSPHPIPPGHYAVMNVGWEYVAGEPPPPPEPNYSAQNKATATQLLQQTDWTCTVDINNPEYSNPYLMNQDQFLAYRSQVRAIAVNPPTTLVEFPPMPNEVWGNT